MGNFALHKTMPYQLKNNTYSKVAKENPQDRIHVEIGDAKQPDKFYPQVKITRWDNEVNFSARLIHDEKNPVIVQESEKIKWQGDKVEAHFYDIEPNPSLLEGGTELEVILKEKPKKSSIKQLKRRI
jgi:hypothetical protein